MGIDVRRVGERVRKAAPMLVLTGFAVFLLALLWRPWLGSWYTNDTGEQCRDFADGYTQCYPADYRIENTGPNGYTVCEPGSDGKYSVCTDLGFRLPGE